MMISCRPSPYGVDPKWFKGPWFEEVPIGFPWVTMFLFWPRRCVISKKLYWWRWVWVKPTMCGHEYDLTKMGPIFYEYEIRPGKWCPTPRGHTP